MNFRPLSVEILGSPRTSMSAGKTYDLVCRTFGSRPAANLTWWIDDRRITGAKQAESGGGNITSSTLPLQPRAEDNGRQLVCRAENSQVAGGSLEHRRQLAVRFAPMVTLKLGYALNPDDIKEGADIYFDCTIHANPPVYSVIWYHDGAPLEPSAGAGAADRVSISERSLVVRNVSSRAAGAYVCKASNPEGDGASRPVLLSVKYAPVCVQGQKRRYGAARHEAVQVTCQVDANPPVVTYKWQFNNSVEIVELAYSQVTSRGLESRATYIPKTERDYGTLLCRADNEIGRMVLPCAFQLVAAGRPDPLRNCSVINQTSDSLEVECAAGFDGGLPQYFVAELYDVAGRRLVRNLTRPFPDFAVLELPPGLELRLELYAANSRGRSRAVTLEGFTLKMPEKRTSKGAGAPPEQPFSVTPILGVLIGLVASLIIIAIGAVACIRNNSGRSRKPATHTDLAAPSVPGKGGAEPGPPPGRAATQPPAKGCDPDDPNPDVVPSRHDPECEVTEGTLMLNHLAGEMKRNNVSSPDYPATKQIKSKLYQDDGIQYAELTLPRAGQAGKVTRGRDPDASVIYASIDHRRGGGPARDTVVRAPLLNNDQESVV
ncbi:nephrin-like [Pollicipes pollicipes]|nr:nephrin-like [Pollicipes pollicipes]